MRLPNRDELLKKLQQRQFIFSDVQEIAFAATTQPLLYLAVRQQESPSSFFQYVAQLCKLKFVETLPVKIFEREATVQQVGLAVAAKYLFFPYFEKQTLVIATADPYAWKDILHACRSKLKFKQHRFVMATPHQIWSALNHSSYIPAQEFAETYLAKQYPSFSSKEQAYLFLQVSLIVGALLLVMSVLLSPVWTAFVILLVLNGMYFLLNPLKVGLALGALLRKPDQLSAGQLKALPASHLPVYTLLIPLKHEDVSIPSLLSALNKLKYPLEKLDIKFTVEVDDASTLQALAAAGISVHETDPEPKYSLCQVVKVPVGEISTKPRSCNYALQFARGELVVIYDAEDQPDPWQLHQAYQTFLESKLNTVCVQAKLNYYNPHQNLLTKCFTAEYTFWFDVLLPALEYWNVPLPLGGTSNHFQTNALKSIGTWDAYNVTEDAEVGWRLSRLGYRTAVMDSYTLEEANSDVWNWIRQRTRWQKGFLLTLLVHMKHPTKLVQELGWRGAGLSVTVFATTVLLPLVNLWLWLYFGVWLIDINTPTYLLSDILPDWLDWITITNLLLGNLAYILMHAVGLVYTRRWSLLWILPLLPLYWVLQSISSYRSVWHIMTKPHLWEKTIHGLHLKEKALAH